MLRYLTAGESHGRSLVAIVEGMPAGLDIEASDIDRDLARRQGGYGRGARMAIEKDKVLLNSGVRHGQTLGSPVALIVANRDWENWHGRMSEERVTPKEAGAKVTRPRPGHADLTGVLKYARGDARDILERSSARETAVRVAAGALAKRLLSEFGIDIWSWVREIGGVDYTEGKESPEKLHSLAEASDVRCPDQKVTQRMKRRIDQLKKRGDSLGGIFRVVATGVPPGLGSHVQWDRKLDGRLAMALMSVQAIKSVEVGMGAEVGRLPGSKVHDEIFYGTASRRDAEFWPPKKRFYRKTNNAGGIEGGMSNGEHVVLSAAMKPIPTLYKPLSSVDMKTKKGFEASVERSDVCAVPAASVVGEAVVAFELAGLFLDKFGGDSIAEIKRNYKGYLAQIGRF
ncbi:Chorismate synthase [hydrothermal vent metagenome]|uniref:chorismate synthase n=1 Tax=hydrothermal vent metagenome TaxID=652676 RepID=A0A3B0VBU0_9ZZZZ